MTQGGRHPGGISIRSYRWHWSLVGIPYQAEEVARSLILVAGPSGCGKTTFSLALSNICPSIAIMQNYTTRAARASDAPNHFSHLSESEFATAHALKHFFLARLSPPPQYGYAGSELASLLAECKRPLLMFRYSGTRFLLRSVRVAITTIFIEANPEAIAAASESIEARPSVEDARESIAANRKLQKAMTAQGWPWIRIVNNYGDVGAMTRVADEFLSSHS